MSLNLVESYYENKKTDNFRNDIFKRLQKRGIVVNGYHSSKGKLGINRERYYCIVESITGYSIHDDLDCEIVRKMYKSLVEFRDKYQDELQKEAAFDCEIACKMYKSLVEFRDKYQDELQKETVFDIRKYIFYYSKCPNERYHLSFDEFNHLIHFFKFLSESMYRFDYAL
jgi:hypothetical protein